MRYHILESGSKGNCTLITHQGNYLVIDNGLSKKKFKNYLMFLNLQVSDIKKVLVTHSHSDHTKGLEIFDKNIILGTRPTLLSQGIEDERNELIPYSSYSINNFKVTVIPTSHDAKGSVGFVIEIDDEKLVYITDTGYLYDKVLNYISNADYYIFESNHDVRMQLATGRPQHLIDRIMGDKGHLSNEDAALYLSEIIGDKTKEISLAHLSEEANKPELALEAFRKIMSKRCVDVSSINIRCASQKEVLSGGNILKEFAKL